MVVTEGWPKMFAFWANFCKSKVIRFREADPKSFLHKVPKFQDVAASGCSRLNPAPLTVGPQGYTQGFQSAYSAKQNPTSIHGGKGGKTNTKCLDFLSVKSILCVSYSRWRNRQWACQTRCKTALIYLAQEAKYLPEWLPTLCRALWGVP